MTAHSTLGDKTSTAANVTHATTACRRDAFHSCARRTGRTQTDDGGDDDHGERGAGQVLEDAGGRKKRKHRQTGDGPRPACAGAGQPVDRAPRERTADRESTADARGHVGQALADELAVGVPGLSIGSRERARDRSRLGEADEGDDHPWYEQGAGLAPRHIEAEVR